MICQFINYFDIRKIISFSEMADNNEAFDKIPLERFDSTDSEVSVKEYDRVPKTTEYVLRLEVEGKRRQLVTKLREGRELPYSKNIAGLSKCSSCSKLYCSSSWKVST